MAKVIRCTLHPRPKKIPKRFEKAHKLFHARGNKPKAHKSRSETTVENLRLSRAIRKQTLARGRFVAKTLFEQNIRN